MIYELKDCRTGESETERRTTLAIERHGEDFVFVFTAENCKYFCPYGGKYNELHSQGDACEILIGSDPMRKVYYEIEISASNGLMIAKMTYNGERDGGKEILLDINFVEKPFVKSEVSLRDGGSVARLTVPLSAIKTGDGEVFFNAYRLDTDGGRFLVDDQLMFALNPTLRNRFHTPNKFLLLKDFI